MANQFQKQIEEIKLELKLNKVPDFQSPSKDVDHITQHLLGNRDAILLHKNLLQGTKVTY